MSAIPRVAPRMPWNSESCSENGLFTQELFVQNWGGSKASEKKTNYLLNCFHASFFPFCPLCWPPIFLPFSRHIFALFSNSKSSLFCRAKGTAQSLERGASGMDLSTKFGKEIPSRNLRKKRSAYVSFVLGIHFSVLRENPVMYYGKICWGSKVFQ